LYHDIRYTSRLFFRLNQWFGPAGFYIDFTNLHVTIGDEQFPINLLDSNRQVWPGRSSGFQGMPG